MWPFDYEFMYTSKMGAWGLKAHMSMPSGVKVLLVRNVRLLVGWNRVCIVSAEASLKRELRDDRKGVARS